MYRKNKLILLLIFVIGIVLRLNNLGGRSLWTDEFFTLFQSTGHGRIQQFLDTFSTRDYPELFKAKYFKSFLKNDPLKGIKDVSEGLIKEDTHPPLYFIIMHIWMKVFGDSAWRVRIFSVLFGLICILLAYKVGLYLFNEKAALFSALFVSISPFAVRYSQEARAYSFITAIGLASWLVILRFGRRRRIFDLALLGLLNCAGIFTHYFYIFLSCAQFAFISVIYKRDSLLRRRLYLSFLFSMLFFFVCFVLFYLKTYKFYLTEWLFGYSGTIVEKTLDLFYDITHYFLVFNTPKIYHLFPALLLIFYILRHRKELFPCLIMLFVPLLAMLFLDVIQQGILLKQERFGTFSFVGFIPVAGYILSNAIPRLKVVVYSFIIFMLFSSFSVAGRQYGPAPQFISGWINNESRDASSAVIVCNIRSVVAAQSNYLDDDIYLVPVASQRQLLNGVKVLSGFVSKIFIVRHFHWADPFLMDKSFMDIKDISSGFRFEKALLKDNISVAEFVKCGL